MNQLADREIEAAINRFIRDDSRVDGKEIDVHVEEGTVYLTGRVDSAAEKKAVEEDVEAAGHVNGVINQITLRNYIERSDEELKEEVRHALMRDTSVDISLIKVAAKEGEVTLDGNVDSHAQKNIAEDIAWWTPGVTNVISHLQVLADAEVPQDLKE